MIGRLDFWRTGQGGPSSARGGAVKGIQIMERIFERPTLVVKSDDARETLASFSTTVYSTSPQSVQVCVDMGPASFVLYLKAGDLLALSKLFDDAASAVGG